MALVRPIASIVGVRGQLINDHKLQERTLATRRRRYGDDDGSTMHWLARLGGGAEPREGPELQVPDSLGVVVKYIAAAPCARPAGSATSPRSLVIDKFLDKGKIK